MGVKRRQATKTAKSLRRTFQLKYRVVVHGVPLCESRTPSAYKDREGLDGKFQLKSWRYAQGGGDLGDGTPRQNRRGEGSSKAATGLKTGCAVLSIGTQGGMSASEEGGRPCISFSKLFGTQNAKDGVTS